MKKHGRVEPPTWRRQANEAFCDKDGNFSPGKSIAVAAQIAALYWFGVTFDRLIDKPESMLIVLTFLIAPDTIKKFLSMKYGNGNGAKPKVDTP